jgi:hypothetical protein
MGWEVVGRVPVAVRPCGVPGGVAMLRSRVASSHWPTPMSGGATIDYVADRLTATANRPKDVRVLSTDRTAAFLRWRYGLPLLGYRVVEHAGAAAVVRLRARGRARELVVLDTFGDRATTDRVAADAARTERATHVLRTGTPNVVSRCVPVPGGGPILTWRSVNRQARPPLPNWQLSMGDVELF